MHEAMKTDPRELSIRYLMVDDANLSRADAEALYDATPGQCDDTMIAALALLDVKMPLSVDQSDSATVVDAEGRDVLVIDVNGRRPNNQVAEIAEFVALACNAYAGFSPVPLGWRIVNADRRTVMWDYDRERVAAVRAASYPDMKIEPMWSHAPEPASSEAGQ